MSESKYGEPWAVDINSYGESLILTTRNGEPAIGNDPGGIYCDIDRIVACVNACAGVENVGGLGSVARLVEVAENAVDKICDGIFDNESVAKSLTDALAEFEKAGGE